MSQQFYWAAVAVTPSAKQKIWPTSFHKTKTGAQRQASGWNRIYKRKEFHVMRFLLETKDAVHYDVYKHEFKRI